MLLAASAPFEWLKVWSCCANRPPEAVLSRTNGLDEPDTSPECGVFVVRDTFDVSEEVTCERVQEGRNFAARVRRRCTWQLSEESASGKDGSFEFILDFRQSKEAEFRELLNNKKQTNLFVIRSDRTLLSRSTRLPVRRYFWYIPSRSHQGAFDEKKSFSIWRACDHVMFSLRSADEGCLTQNQLFSSGSFSLRMKGSQLDSSPVGIRSGLVRTPMARHQQILIRLNIENSNKPIVRFPSGSCCLAKR